MELHQTILTTHLTDRKRRNSQFSLRSFAKLLEISPGQLSSLINGKKNLTTKQAVKIIEKLNLSEEDSLDLIRGLHPKLKDLKVESLEENVLTEDQFRMISNWHHFAVLSLGSVRDNQATAKWVSDRIGIDPTSAQLVLERLARLEMIEIKNGKFRQSSKPLNTKTEIPSRVIRDYHHQNLRLAAEKLENVAVELREFSAITMAVDARKLAKAKKMINEFKQRLCKELETREATEVYTLSMQLFPLTIQENAT
jgi:plasmid maintenance system antidote protein VapI